MPRQCSVPDCDQQHHAKGLCKQHYDIGQNAAYRASHLDAARNRAMAYNAAHRPETAARNTAYRASHLDALAAYHVAYRAAHREKNIAYQMAYRAAHRPKPRVYNAAVSAAYHAAHRDKYAALNAAWGTAHPEKVREKSHRRRARLQAAFVAPISVDEIYARDKGTCQICGKVVPRKVASLDHILPLAEGGTHEPRNVRIVHRRCNTKRGAHGPAQLRLLS